MQYQDYLAALERLRRVASGELSHVVYPGANGPQDRVSDKLTVCDFEHDDTPATVEWLREVLGKPESTHRDVCQWPVGRDSVDIFASREFVSVRFACTYHLLENPTRGDVLRLLGVFNERKSTC